MLDNNRRNPFLVQASVSVLPGQRWDVLIVRSWFSEIVRFIVPLNSFYVIMLSLELAR